MDVRLATQKEVTKWHTYLARNPDGGSLYQSPVIANLKRFRRPVYLFVGNYAVTAHELNVPFLGRFWYVPRGPGVISPKELEKVTTALSEYARKNDVFAIKIEPALQQSTELDKIAAKRGYIRNHPIQPNASTVILDISGDDESVLMSFNQKGRHAIRRGMRDGVICSAVPATDENCRIMYNLMQQTKTGQLHLRPFRYYRAFWQGFAADKHGQLFFATFDGRILAGAYAIIMGINGTYKDGGSVRDRPVYGSSHALQWDIMLWMKKHGATNYDLCGTPPPDKIHDESHPQYNIGRFKTSFSKTVTQFVGTYDIVLNDSKYRLWRKYIERGILAYYGRILRQSWY